MKRWYCITCGYIYDEAAGLPDYDIPAGTAFADLPDDWLCPDCGSDKSYFELYEE